MFNDINLRDLARRSGPERAFLSLYLAGPASMQALDGRIRKVRGLLRDDPIEGEYFEENLKLVQQHLEEQRFKAGSLCVFACWAEDYLQAFALEQPVPDLLWVDSSPYIRPLAELQDEYENFVVVAADNTDTRIYLVTSAVADQEARVKGDVKNHVKVGGWSQKRYERRRDKALQHYAKEIAEVLLDLDQRASFDRIVLLGSAETLREIEGALPEPLAEKLLGKESVDLTQDEALWEEAYGMFFAEERASEEKLWERIKGAYLRGERAAVGAEDVLQAASVGRVEQMIVTRDAKITGIRCRACENLTAGTPEACPVCSADDVFKVDLVNELVELLTLSSAGVEFVDPIPGLSESGDVAALLRY